MLKQDTQKSLRIVVDYSAINGCVKHLGQCTPSVEAVVRKMGPGNQYFVMSDFTLGYWQVPLSPVSRLITTFITDRQKMVWTCLPMGLNCLSDNFLRLTDKVLQNANV